MSPLARLAVLGDGIMGKRLPLPSQDNCIDYQDGLKGVTLLRTEFAESALTVSLT